MRNLNRTVIAIVLLIPLMLFSVELIAQCPMCKTNLEGARQVEGSTIGAGINTGIMYLFTAPFLCVAILGIYWYRNSRKNVEV